MMTERELNMIDYEEQRRLELIRDEKVKLFLEQKGISIEEWESVRNVPQTIGELKNMIKYIPDDEEIEYDYATVWLSIDENVEKIIFSVGG